uniref:Uncharacterized protein n=1 Tax=Glossina pallidipes TaxID=7398 RepID=A0A1B0ADH0_GLOPL
MYFYACACKHFGLLLGYGCALGHILRFLTMKNIIALVCIVNGKTDFVLGNDEQYTRDYCNTDVPDQDTKVGNLQQIVKPVAFGEPPSQLLEMNLLLNISSPVT